MADETYAHHHRKEEEDVELKREEKIKEESLEENEKRKDEEEQAKEATAKVAEVSSPVVVVVRSRGIAGLPTFSEFHVKNTSISGPNSSSGYASLCLFFSFLVSVDSMLRSIFSFCRDAVRWHLVSSVPFHSIP